MAELDGDPLVAFCRSLPGATEDIKWESHLVFSVGGKMFAMFGSPEEAVRFKVDPDEFAVLVQQPGIIPAPYLARASWVRLETRDALPREMVEDLLRDSHALVAAKLPKRVRSRLGLDR